MTERLVVRLTPAEITALLDALPRCSACRHRGEIVVNNRLLCISCAGPHRGAAHVESPAWCDAGVSLDEALLTR